MQSQDKPKKVLHFSDGVAEFSDDDEVDNPEIEAPAPIIDEVSTRVDWKELFHFSLYGFIELKWNIYKLQIRSS